MERYKGETSAFIIGNGTDNTNRSNLVYAWGNKVEISGSTNITGSLFLNGVAITSGGGSADTLQSVTTAGSTTTSSVQIAAKFVQGFGNIAFAPYSHAQGENSYTYGTSSHAEGQQSTAIGPYSHAEGFSTEAIGTASHAEGINTIALGDYSHAEGQLSTAIGYGSHAQGSGGVTLGNFSFASGLGTYASGTWQNVFGQYNLSSSANSAFIIGNGSSTAARSNLMYAAGTQVQITGSLVVNLGNYASDVAAAAGGVPVNGLYHNAGAVRIRLT
jgi:hypothetical protein